MPRRARARTIRPGRCRPRGFTLVELLIVAAVVALLIAILAPSLGASRRAAESAVCSANLRSCFTACAVFAHDHNGRGPAIGVPYTALPNWALVVQAYSGVRESGPAAYRADGALACTGASRFYGRAMTRTYAMNGVGHNRQAWNTDPDNYDDQSPAPSPPVAIRFDLVRLPSEFVLLIDGARNPQQPPLPEGRCASVVDFRPDANMADRIGRYHPGASGGSAALNAASFDGAVRAFADVPDRWLEALP